MLLISISCLAAIISVGISVPFLPVVLGSRVASSVGVPATNFNTSKTFRMAVVGDVDANRGLTTQLEIANQYNVHALVLAGDIEYTNGKNVLANLLSWIYQRKHRHSSWKS